MAFELGPDLFDYLNKRQFVGNRVPPRYGLPGLESSDLDAIEAAIGDPLPPDLKYLLRNVQDPGGVLAPLTDFTPGAYDASVNFVRRGIEFDIEQSATWLRRWGPRPADTAAALAIARADMETWPKLVPISGHRFLPITPCLVGNPVFSVVQTDIIYYGANLASYLLGEFVSLPPRSFERPGRRIDIWSDFAEDAPGFRTVPVFGERDP